MYKNPTKPLKYRKTYAQFFKANTCTKIYKNPRNLKESKKPKKRKKEQHFKDTKDTVRYCKVKVYN